MTNSNTLLLAHLFVASSLATMQMTMEISYGADIQYHRPIQQPPSENTLDADDVAAYSKTVAGYLNREPLALDKLPVAYLVNRSRIVELTCPEKPKLCASKVAIFDKRYFYILLDDSLKTSGTEVLSSFVIHELTHVYQFFYQRNEARNPCNRQLQNEREAYRMQNRFLSDTGFHYNFGQELRGALCPPMAGTEK